MRIIFLIAAVFFCGCTPIPVVTPEAKFAVELAKTLDTSHAVEMAALNEQAEILLRIESAVVGLTPPGDSDSRPAISDSSTVPGQVSPPSQDGVEVLVADCCDDRPTLCITYADFNCPPCERLKADIAAGKLDAFAITYDPAGQGLDNLRPAIRFERATSATGYAVMYGYNDAILSFLKAELLPQTMASTAERDTVISLKPVAAQPRSTKPVVNQSDLISIHNRLHGGQGQWTWPGDLATYLRTTHGYNATGSASSSSSCPGGNCPTSRRSTYRRIR